MSSFSDVRERLSRPSSPRPSGMALVDEWLDGLRRRTEIADLYAAVR